MSEPPFYDSIKPYLEAERKRLKYNLHNLWHNGAYIYQAFWFYLGATAMLLIHNFITAGYSMPIHIPTALKLLSIPWAIYSFGYLNGHLFWGKKYIKGG